MAATAINALQNFPFKPLPSGQTLHDKSIASSFFLNRLFSFLNTSNYGFDVVEIAIVALLSAKSCISISVF